MCRAPVLVGQAVSPARPYHARIPQKIAPFPSQRGLHIPDLASIRITTRQSRFYCVPNTRPRLLGSRPCLRWARLGTSMAERPSNCRFGRSSHSDRGWREAFLSTLCLGGDAEPRSFADSSWSPNLCADEMVERLDGQKRKPDSGPDRAAVLAGRVLRS